MDIGSVILHRFDVAFLKCAGCAVSFDNEPAAVELSIRLERNPVVVFHEYLAADRLVAGPGAVDIGGVGRTVKKYSGEKHEQRQRKAVRGRHRDPPARSELLHVLYVTIRAPNAAGRVGGALLSLGASFDHGARSAATRLRSSINTQAQAIRHEY